MSKRVKRPSLKRIRVFERESKKTSSFSPVVVAL